MGSLFEKRQYERYHNHAELVYSKADTNSYSNARMSNCSSGGMYFNSDYAIKPGTDICIKMLNLRSIFNAKVVRCLEMLTPTGAKFGIGIQYEEPVLG